MVYYNVTSGYPWPSATVKSPSFFKPRETHTKAQSSYFYFYFIYFLWQKSVEKSPVKTYMVKRAFWKISEKNLNRHISRRGKKKSFEIATFWGERKTGFEIAEICGGFGQNPSFLLLKRVYRRTIGGTDT